MSALARHRCGHPIDVKLLTRLPRCLARSKRPLKASHSVHVHMHKTNTARLGSA
jgi:hypothetical protein